MELSEDKLRDYFMDRATPDEVEQIELALAAGDTEFIDRAMRGILDDMVNPSYEDQDYAREAFIRFRKAVEQSRAWRVKRMFRSIGIWGVRIAAALSLPLAVGLAWLLVHDRSYKSVEWIDVSVPAGECRVVELPDGSVLNLNAGSRVIYPSRFTGHDRRVFFAGEVFAEVSKDIEHPFVLSVGDVSVHVFGTKFNFRAYDNLDNLEVALVEGSVLFKPSELEGALLRPGELIQYNRETHSLIRDTFNPEGYPCPAMGTGFFFNNLPLKDIVAQLEHNFNVRIIVEAPRLLTQNYTAYFSNGEAVDEILSKIIDSGNNHMRISREGRIIHVMAVDQL